MKALPRTPFVIEDAHVCNGADLAKAPLDVWHPSR